MESTVDTAVISLSAPTVDAAAAAKAQSAPMVSFPLEINPLWKDCNAIHCVSQSQSDENKQLKPVPYYEYVFDAAGMGLKVYKVVDRCIMQDSIYNQLKKTRSLLSGSILPEVSCTDVSKAEHDGSESLFIPETQEIGKKQKQKLTNVKKKRIVDSTDTNEVQKSLLQMKVWLGNRVVSNYAYRNRDVENNVSCGLAVMLALQKPILCDKRAIGVYERMKMNRTRLIGNYSDFCEELDLTRKTDGYRVVNKASKIFKCYIKILDSEQTVRTFGNQTGGKQTLYIAQGPNLCYFPTNKRGFVRLGVYKKSRITNVLGV
jgi:hypothetical protein